MADYGIVDQGSRSGGPSNEENKSRICSRPLFKTLLALILGTVALTCGPDLSGPASAKLIDRGGGLIYDTDLNVTWLQDANYAKTSGYPLADANGFMDEPTASAWVAALGYYDSARNVIWSGWRLPTVRPVNGTNFNYALAYNGSSDLGFHITSPQSELSYLYYVELGNRGSVETNGTFRSPLPSPIVGPFVNLQCFTPTGYLVAYWTGVTYGANPDCVWDFLTFDGMQAYQYRDSNRMAAWPVRDGDVLPVPWLTISREGANATIAWPVQFSTFHLQENASPSTANWTNVAIVPTNDGRHFRVTLPANKINRSFRVVSP